MNNNIDDVFDKYMQDNNMSNGSGGTKVKVTKELQAVANALNAYVQANNGGGVAIVASLIAFDKEKLDAKADDVIVDGSDRMFAFGDLEGLRISLNDLRDVVEDNVDEDGMVAL